MEGGRGQERCCSGAPYPTSDNASNKGGTSRACLYERNIHRTIGDSHKKGEQLSRVIADHGEVTLMLAHDHHKDLPAGTGQAVETGLS